MNKYSIIIGCVLFLTACSNDDIATPVADNMAGQRIMLTRASLDVSDTVASTSWWDQLLGEGIDVQYGLDANDLKAANVRKTDNTYSLTLKNGVSAPWLGNGYHIFRGIHYPKNINDSTAKDYFTALEQYISIPANTRIMATVGKINIPFHHRLAHIVLSIDIDERMQEDVKNDGFVDSVFIDKVEIRNVHVLDSVKDGCPIWKTDSLLTPREIGYRKYDFMAEPTYQLMYDEQSNDGANGMDIIVTLNTGLVYKRHIDFDLDSNQELKVKMNIYRQRVALETSVADRWTETTYDNGYFTAEDGFNLSYNGSSWQRAYRYSEHTDDWLTMLAEAYKGGRHHGDYFILDQDLTVDSAAVPVDLAFTGHLDGRGHTLTITSKSGTPRTTLFPNLDADYTTVQEEAEDKDLNKIVWEAHVHRESRNGKAVWVPLKGKRAEIINLKIR